MISVIMSVYDEPIEWLSQAVDSIIAQTLIDFEFIIIVDNPNLKKNIKEYLESLIEKDNRVSVFYNETNIGLALSLNRGISLSNGDFLARMDADDISFPERLELEMDFLAKQDADMVSTSGYVIDENSKVIKRMDDLNIDPSNDLLYSNCILHPSVLMKKSVAVQLGCYRNFRRSQDYDLWLRMLSDGFTIRILNKPLLYYRTNLQGLSFNNRLEQYYTHLYQIKLFKQRQKKGQDNYSYERYIKYLKSKRISKKKNLRCLNCFKHLQNAKDLRKDNKNYLSELLKAYFCYPSIVLRSVYKTMRRK